MFRYEFGQAVFKNNCSRKKLSDIKKRMVAEQKLTYKF